MVFDLADERQELFNQIAAGVSAGKVVFLYGMGNGADKLLNRCNQLQIPIQGVFASNEFARGQTYRGYRVQSYDWTLAQWGSPMERKRAIILVAFGSEDPAVLERLAELEESFDLYVPDLALFGQNRAILSFGRRRIEETGLLFEEESRQRFADLINYKITGRLPYLRRAWGRKAELYNALDLGGPATEYYVDAGAYDGDTVEEVRQYILSRDLREKPENLEESRPAPLPWGSIRPDPLRRLKVLAIEPDPKNRRKLEAYKREVWDQSGKPEDLTILPCALSDKAETLSFDNAAGRNSALSKNGRLPVEARPLDELTERATLVKMDVEGAEEPALLGAARLLARQKPRLIISAYHRSGDLLTLPELVRRLNPDYRLALRQSPYVPAWDTNIIAW